MAKQKPDGAVLDDLPPIDVKPVGGSNGPLRMDFPAAMRALLRGLRITRLEWGNPEIYVEIADEYLIIHRDSKNFQLLLRVGDMFAEDWIVVDKEQ